jgi:hypothetical protein
VPSGTVRPPLRPWEEAGPAYDTVSRTTVPRPVAAAALASSGSSRGPSWPLLSEPSAPAGSLVVDESRASVHSPGSATWPGPGGLRSAARSSRPPALTTLLVPATAVAASAGAAVSASERTVVEVSMADVSSAGTATAAAWSRSASRCWPSLRL